jgi:hypothetical protein
LLLVGGIRRAGGAEGGDGEQGGGAGEAEAVCALCIHGVFLWVAEVGCGFICAA